MYKLYEWFFIREKQINTAADIFFVVLLFVTLFSGLWLLLNTEPAVWIDLFSDDAYYYFGIARNIVEQGSSRFLPPFETNGYQPLWLLILTGVGYLFGTSASNLVIQAYLISFLFIFIFFTVSNKRYGIGFPAIICSFAIPVIMLKGMETTMLPAFFILFMTATSWKLRGVFGSLLFLTRLDAISVVIARDLYFYLRKRKPDFRHYVIIIPVLLIYASINYYYFGFPLPISGLAKSVGKIIGENFHVSFGYILALKQAALLFIAISLFLFFKKQPLSALRFRDEFSVLLIACCICMVYYGTLSGWPLWNWYYWTPFLLTYYLLMETVFAIKQIAESKRGYLNDGLVTLLLLALLIFLKPALGLVKGMIGQVKNSSAIASLDPSFGRKNLELVAWIMQKKIPAHSLFAMGDRAGSFGFFLGNNFQFLHTEGLVGPPAYYKAMTDDTALSFVNALDISYWVAEREQFIETPQIIGVVEPVQGLSSHRGPYVICFAKTGIVLDQSYIAPQYRSLQEYEYRYVFDMRSRVNCPTEITVKFAELKQRYGGIRAFSLPLEYKMRDAFSRFVNLPW
ncbi:MAG: hypothetical protein HOP02_06120 [Methylococcaceae bacterium]|nr:hypothetical protein [Methylococcaceae bacterium]